MFHARPLNGVPTPRKSKDGYAARRNFVYQESRMRPNAYGLLESVCTMVLGHLTALREELGDCQVVALVDLSSGIVLGVSARDKQPQEKLDACCEVATKLLFGNIAATFANALGLHQPTVLSQCLILTKSQTTVFVRSATDASEALILVCKPRVDIAKVLDAAMIKLEAISAEQ